MGLNVKTSSESSVVQRISQDPLLTFFFINIKNKLYPLIFWFKKIINFKI